MTIDSKLRVGFAGLGRMGWPMALRLAEADLLSGVYNRTSARTDAFASATGVKAASLPQLASQSNVIMTMVADEDASYSLFTRPEGLLAGLQPGTVVIEMATVSPGHARRMAHLLDRTQCTFVDAPVSGSITMAAAGGLTILAGGASADIHRLQPIFAALGTRTFHLGDVGSGITMKLAVNTAIYALNQGIAEALVLSERAGIARSTAYEVFAASAVAAPFVHYRRELFERPEVSEPALTLDLAAKDLRLIVALASQLNLDLIQARTDLAVLMQAAAAGLGGKDVSAVAEFIRRQQPSEDGNRISLTAGSVPGNVP